jgi:hypothetical protein
VPILIRRAMRRIYPLSKGQLRRTQFHARRCDLTIFCAILPLQMKIAARGTPRVRLG